MKSCEQSENQSVLDHGLSVKNYLFDLLNHLRKDSPLKYKWNIPDFIYENKEFILSQLPDDRTLKLYTVLHDCGKPFCLTIDDDGKRHFPNHADVSFNIFNQLYDNPIAADLIKHDMDIHTLKSAGVEEFCKNPYHITSLLVGLCELHSNAELFGGLDSTSYKIKLKSFTQRGKQIFKK